MYICFCLFNYIANTLYIFNVKGEIQSKGVVLPFTQDIYRPMLRRLKLEGIEAREHITHGQSIPLVAENVSY